MQDDIQEPCQLRFSANFALEAASSRGSWRIFPPPVGKADQLFM
jgi:hypothetical protein